MYTDPESRISVSSNGSAAAKSFMSTFQKAVHESIDLKQAQKEVLKKQYGNVYFVNPDGWATKCKQKGDNIYEGTLHLYPAWLVPEIGELLCVGWAGDKCNQNFVIYKIVKVRPNILGMGHCVVYGEEVEEFSTDEKITAWGKDND